MTPAIFIDMAICQVKIYPIESAHEIGVSLFGGAKLP